MELPSKLSQSIKFIACLYKSNEFKHRGILSENIPDSFILFVNQKDQLLLIFKKQMGVLRQMSEYLFIRKKDPNAPNTQFVRYMHGINRISLIMFLVGITILCFKLFSKRS
jgi:hypothetical protein